MASTVAMLRAIRRANAQRSPGRSRQFTLHCAEDEDLPQWLKDLWRPQDSVVVRCYPAGYMPMDESADVSYGWMVTSSNRVLLIYRDGRKKWKV